MQDGEEGPGVGGGGGLARQRRWACAAAPVGGGGRRERCWRKAAVTRKIGGMRVGAGAGERTDTLGDGGAHPRGMKLLVMLDQGLAEFLANDLRTAI